MLQYNVYINKNNKNNKDPLYKYKQNKNSKTIKCIHKYGITVHGCLYVAMISSWRLQVNTEVRIFNAHSVAQLQNP